MENNIAIKVENITKKYNLGKIHRGIFSFFFKKKNKPEEFFALKNISFEIKKGDTVGLIGRNGSGKSTLLKIMGGITYPTFGDVTINGGCSVVMESGIGFHKDLTGYENIFIQGQLMGMDKEYIKSKLDEIIDFSEIREFINTPIKHYSSGMVSRLSFSVIAILSNEILLFDEVLSFGDFGFHQKALRKIKNLSESGRTIISISHNLNDIVSFSNRILVLRNGELVADGLPSDIIPDFIEEILLVRHNKESTSKEKLVKNSLNIKDHSLYGPTDIKLKDFRFLSANSDDRMILSISKPLEIKFKLEIYNISTDWDFGIIVRDVTESIIFTSTIFEEINMTFQSEGEVNGICTIPSNLFNLGTYFIYPYFTNYSKKEFIPIKDFISFRTQIDENKKNIINKYLGPIKIKIDWKI